MEAVCELSVGARHQGGEVLEKPASVVSYDGADDCGGDGRGVPEVHTGEQDIGRDISECGG